MRDLINIVENAQDEAFVAKAPVSLLAKVWNPFEHSPWPEVLAISRDDVRAALAEQRSQTDRYDDVLHRFRAQDMAKDRARAYHAERIAYLVQHPSDDPLTMLEDGRGGWELHDGFHRLAAAIYRGDAAITVRASDPEGFIGWLSYFEGD